MKPALKNGLLLGFTLIFAYLVQYIIDRNIYLNWWLQLIITSGASLYYMIVASLQKKKDLNGNINILDGFKTTIIVFAIGAIASSLFTFILFNYIDLNLSDYAKERTIALTAKTMKSFDIPEIEIQKAIEELNTRNYKPTILSTLYNIGEKIIYGIIISIIISLIVKLKSKFNSEVG